MIAVSFLVTLSFLGASFRLNLVSMLTVVSISHILASEGMSLPYLHPNHQQVFTHNKWLCEHYPMSWHGMASMSSAGFKEGCDRIGMFILVSPFLSYSSCIVGICHHSRDLNVTPASSLIVISPGARGQSEQVDGWQGGAGQSVGEAHCPRGEDGGRPGPRWQHQAEVCRRGWPRHRQRQVCQGDILYILYQY